MSREETETPVLRSEIIALILGILLVITLLVASFRGDKIEELQGMKPYNVGEAVVCETNGVDLGRYTGHATNVRTETKMIYVGSGFSAWVNYNQCERFLR